MGTPEGRRDALVSGMQEVYYSKRSDAVYVSEGATPTAIDFVAGKGWRIYDPRERSKMTEENRSKADQGDASTQYNLGVMHLNGEGVIQDDVEAAHWFRLAAEQGLAGAQFRLGTMYRLGQGVVQDYVEAVRLYRLAAEQGLAEAQFYLGVMYRDGQGVAQDDVEAVRLWRLAAEQGDTDAEFNLGMMHLHSAGV